jgi:hypothetical protein
MTTSEQMSPGWGQEGGTCKCGSEPSGSVKCGEFIDQLRTCQLLKKDLMSMVPYILVTYKFHCKSDEMHTDFFTYSLLNYICSTCFGRYLRPSSGAQTEEYSHRYAWLFRCVGRWIVQWSRLRLGPCCVRVSQPQPAPMDYLTSNTP